MLSHFTFGEFVHSPPASAPRVRPPPPFEGSFMPGLENVPVADARHARALRLCDKYIRDDAQYEINIDASMKRKIVGKIERKEFEMEAGAEGNTVVGCVNFDEARMEIYKLMRDNLWMKFKKCAMYGDSITEVVKRHASQMVHQGGSFICLKKDIDTLAAYPTNSIEEEKEFSS